MRVRDLPQVLQELKERNRLREPDDSRMSAEMQDQFGPDFLDLATNDYLGLAGSPKGPPGANLPQVDPPDVSRETGDSREEVGPLGQGEGRQGQGTSEQLTEGTSGQAGSSDNTVFVSRETVPAFGARASRLIFGSASEHLSVEREVAAWLGMPEALLFSSGYAANVGALGALLSPEDAVFSDEHNHASLIDGVRLSRAKPRIFPHLDLGELERGLTDSSSAPARWVIAESYYSMDGDGPDLARLRELCDRYDAGLYVDEAHSVGTFGPRGAGLCAQAGVRADVLMAAFGKAVGSQGACVLGSAELRTFLWNRARSFVFSTAPSPMATKHLLDQVLRTQEAESERVRLNEVCALVRARLKERGVPLIPGSFGPVVGVVLGSEVRALSAAAALRAQGFLVQAVRPPTVPEGGSRIRLVLRSGLSKTAIDRLVEAVSRETSTACQDVLP